MAATLATAAIASSVGSGAASRRTAICVPINTMLAPMTATSSTQARISATRLSM
jgi:hypothetical protein